MCLVIHFQSLHLGFQSSSARVYIRSIPSIKKVISQIKFMDPSKQVELGPSLAWQSVLIPPPAKAVAIPPYQTALSHLIACHYENNQRLPWSTCKTDTKHSLYPFKSPPSRSSATPLPESALEAHLTVLRPQASLKIPHCIHFVWLALQYTIIGARPPPTKYSARPRQNQATIHPPFRWSPPPTNLTTAQKFELESDLSSVHTSDKSRPTSDQQQSTMDSSLKLLFLISRHLSHWRNIEQLNHALS